jgi:hypothetical protein
MHKISNFTGQARHGWERMAPASFGGMSRFQQDMPAPTPQPLRRPQGSPAIVSPLGSEPSTVNLSFNVPFASSLAGPEPDEILHSSPGAFQRWTFPAGTAEGTPIHQLPVHQQNEERLRSLCTYIGEQSGGHLQASVAVAEIKAGTTFARQNQGFVTNVCISGDGDLVYKMRAKILNETPILMVRIAF